MARAILALFELCEPSAFREQSAASSAADLGQYGSRIRGCLVGEMSTHLILAKAWPGCVRCHGWRQIQQ